MSFWNTSGSIPVVLDNFSVPDVQYESYVGRYTDLTRNELLRLRSTKAPTERHGVRIEISIALNVRGTNYTFLFSTNNYHYLPGVPAYVDNPSYITTIPRIIWGGTFYGGFSNFIQTLYGPSDLLPTPQTVPPAAPCLGGKVIVRPMFGTILHGLSVARLGEQLKITYAYLFECLWTTTDGSSPLSNFRRYVVIFANSWANTRFISGMPDPTLFDAAPEASCSGALLATIAKYRSPVVSNDLVVCNQFTIGNIQITTTDTI